MWQFNEIHLNLNELGVHLQFCGWIKYVVLMQFPVRLSAYFQCSRQTSSHSYLLSSFVVLLDCTQIAQPFLHFCIVHEA